MTYKKTNEQAEDNITDVIFLQCNGSLCSEAAIGALMRLAYLYPELSNMCYDAIDEIERGDSHDSEFNSSRSTTLTLVK